MLGRDCLGRSCLSDFATLAETDRVVSRSDRGERGATVDSLLCEYQTYVPYSGPRTVTRSGGARDVPGRFAAMVNKKSDHPKLLVRDLREQPRQQS